MARFTSIDTLTMETAVLGGAILGCGGGGKLEDGLYLGELATAQGRARLIKPAEISANAVVAAVMPVHTSGSDTYQIHPRQTHHALLMLQDDLQTTADGLINGGIGAVDTVIGWELSGFLDVPLLDLAVSPAFHTSSLANLLAFLKDSAAAVNFSVSLAGQFENGRGHQELWHGHPEELQRRLAGLPAMVSESYMAAVGPLPLSIMADDQQNFSVSRAILLGEAMLAVNENGGEATVTVLQSLLPCRLSTFATVTGISWHGQGQDRYGLIDLRDISSRQMQLTYNHRYCELLIDGQKSAVFPDLIITLGILGTPLTGEEVFIGQDLYLMVVTQSVF